LWAVARRDLKCLRRALESRKSAFLLGWFVLRCRGENWLLGGSRWKRRGGTHDVGPNFKTPSVEKNKHRKATKKKKVRNGEKRRGPKRKRETGAKKGGGIEKDTDREGEIEGGYTI